jgi:CO/xanthine dehydrogenase FAD-binding subunit
MSYQIVRQLDQALRLLREGGGEARIIAGGTDLFLQPLPPILLDLSSLPEAALLMEKENQLVAGACVTHTAAAASPLLQARATALAEACGQVGSPQVRNLGTLGGNVVNAAPAADAAVALVALGARAVIVDTVSSYREEAVENLYEQYNRSKVDSSKEILLRFLLNAHGPGEGSAFQRFASRKALSLPMFSVAASVRVERGLLQEVRLVAAPVKPAPTRLLQVEEKLKGLPAAEETWRLAAGWAREEITVRSSPLRCSADYRRQLAGVLTARVLEGAAQRAVQNEAGEGR